MAPLSNWIAGSRISRSLFSTIGVTSQRPPPEFAHQSFSRWFREHGAQPQLQRKVLLYLDTYTQYNEPEIGKAALACLNAAGFEVIVPEWRCCGRPLYSKGLLKQAKQKAEAVVELLAPYARQKIPIIGLEPSCLLSIKEDYYGLMDHPDLQTVADQCVMLDDFLCEHIGEFPVGTFRKSELDLQIHTHCHQKASARPNGAFQLLSHLPGVSASEIPSGCCGMAGSFGYEAEHYDLSMKIGNMKLFPAIRQANPASVVVANGFSCRHQIAHGVEKRAVHVAELFASRLAPL